jgi:hypothetical protein
MMVPTAGQGGSYQLQLLAVVSIALEDEARIGVASDRNAFVSRGIKWATDTETMLFIAGQVACGRDGTPMHAGDFKVQARAALQCQKAQVEAGGGTMANIVKVNTYLNRHPASRGLQPDPRGVLRKKDAGTHATGGRGLAAPSS